MPHPGQPEIRCDMLIGVVPTIVMSDSVVRWIYNQGNSSWPFYQSHAIGWISQRRSAKFKQLL